MKEINLWMRGCGIIDIATLQHAVKTQNKDKG